MNKLDAVQRELSDAVAHWRNTAGVNRGQGCAVPRIMAFQCTGAAYSRNTRAKYLSATGRDNARANWNLLCAKGCPSARVRGWLGGVEGRRDSTPRRVLCTRPVCSACINLSATRGIGVSYLCGSDAPSVSRIAQRRLIAGQSILRAFDAALLIVAKPGDW